MSTGYKINHAGDNAANYSISQNMNVQLSACDIAADNIAMVMDLLQTAQDTISLMQSRGSRLQSLITQARNGTYGVDSQNAMLSEAQAIMNEITRLYQTTEYNGLKLFSTINITNAFARMQGDIIGFEGTYDGTPYSSGQMDTWLSNIQTMNLNTNLQVGINSSADSQIVIDTTMNINLSISNLTSDSTFTSVTNFLKQLNNKATELGAAQNRLESALESTLVQIDNLTSSLSTIRDADIGKVSSEYIKQ